MTATDIWSRTTGTWLVVWNWAAGMSVDDFNKIALAFVAVIALFLGPWMQWRIAKRQVQMQADIARRQVADNISSKRQNWIDALRKDAAEFLTVVARIQELKKYGVQQNNAGTAEAFKERLTSEMRARELGTRIKLRLNPNEAEHNRLVELINKQHLSGYDLNRAYTLAEEEQAALTFNEAHRAIVEHLQIILKHEWERVKKGDV